MIIFYPSINKYLFLNSNKIEINYFFTLGGSIYFLHKLFISLYISIIIFQKIKLFLSKNAVYITIEKFPTWVIWFMYVILFIYLRWALFISKLARKSIMSFFNNYKSFHLILVSAYLHYKKVILFFQKSFIVTS